MLQKNRFVLNPVCHKFTLEKVMQFRARRIDLLIGCLTTLLDI